MAGTPGRLTPVAMPRLLVAVLLVAVLPLAACGSDGDVPGVAGVSEAELEVRRLEAEARLAEARAREAEAASPAAPSETEPPADGATEAAPATPTAPTRSVATVGAREAARPGTTGLPPAEGGADLFSGAKEFRFCETTRQSTLDRYVGMEVCYEGTLRQDGVRLVGEGRKASENGVPLRGGARRPIRVEGFVYGDYSVRFNYTVEGTRRLARGSADLGGDTMSSSGEGLGWPAGTFQSDAANSSGDAFLFIANPIG